VNLSNSVLHRAKPEILRGVELLIDKMQNEMADLLVEVTVIKFFNNNCFYHSHSQHCQ
jgi:type II secretory pathway component GspD/PulD (secretin)